MPLSGIINGVANKQPKRERSARYCEMLSVCSCELVHAHLLAAFRKVVGCQGCCRLRGWGTRTCAEQPAPHSCVLLHTRVHFPVFQTWMLRHAFCELMRSHLRLWASGLSTTSKVALFDSAWNYFFFQHSLVFSAWKSECLCLWQTHYYNLVNKRLS